MITQQFGRALRRWGLSLWLLGGLAGTGQAAQGTLSHWELSVTAKLAKDCVSTESFSQTGTGTPVRLELDNALVVCPDHFGIQDMILDFQVPLETPEIDKIEVTEYRSRAWLKEMMEARFTVDGTFYTTPDTNDLFNADLASGQLIAAIGGTLAPDFWDFGVQRTVYPLVPAGDYPASLTTRCVWNRITYYERAGDSRPMAKIQAMAYLALMDSSNCAELEANLLVHYFLGEAPPETATFTLGGLNPTGTFSAWDPEAPVPADQALGKLKRLEGSALTGRLTLDPPAQSERTYHLSITHGARDPDSGSESAIGIPTVRNGTIPPGTSVFDLPPGVLGDIKANEDADFLDFDLTVVNADGKEVRANPYRLPVCRVKIVGKGYVSGTVLNWSLVTGLDFTLEYATHDPTGKFYRRLLVRLEEIHSKWQSIGPWEVLAEPIAGYGTRRQQFTIPPNFAPEIDVGIHFAIPYEPLFSPDPPHKNEEPLPDSARDICYYDVVATHCMDAGEAVLLLGLSFSDVRSDQGRTIAHHVQKTSLTAVAQRVPPSPGALARVNSKPRRGAGIASSGPPSPTTGEFADVGFCWAFTPTIPPGDFSADLEITYDPAWLESQPELDEARLQIVSYDPDRGGFSRHPTTVDPARRLLRTRIDGLAPYYTLAVFEPFARRQLPLPLLCAHDGSPVQVRLLNPQPVSQNVQLSALHPEGDPWGLPVSINPYVLALAANHGFQQPVDQLFGIVPFAYQAGWIAGDVDAGASSAFIQIGTSAGRSGLCVAPHLAPHLVLPDVRSDSQTETYLHLVNPKPYATRLRLDLCDENGARAGQKEVALPGRGKTWRPVSQMFALTNPVFSGYARIDGDHPFALAALNMSAKTCDARTGLAIGPETAGSSVFVVPGIIAGGATYQTALSLVNLSATAAAVDVIARSENGSDTGTVRRTVAPGAQLLVDLASLFGWSQETRATLLIQSPTSSLAGIVTLRDATSNGRFAASMPLIAMPKETHLFAIADCRSDSFTSLAVHNPSNQPAQLEVGAWRLDGTPAGRDRFTLGAGQSRIQNLPEWLPATAGIADGYFTVQAFPAVHAAAWVGLGNLSSLIALPSLPVRSDADRLLAEAAADHEVRLRWPDSVLAFRLEHSANLANPASWLPLEVTPAIADGWCTVSQPAQGTHRFYRLARPSAHGLSRSVD